MPIPIPTTRSSDLLVNQRMLSQLQFNQNELLKVQSQLSTGRRIGLPSEDAPSALRAIGLQRILEQKQQVQVNLNTSQSYLTATEITSSNAASLIADIRGQAVTAADTTTSETQRFSFIQEVSQTIDQLIDIGNKQFRGRYLFAGSDTTAPPFSTSGRFIKYDGNESTLKSFADVDLLMETNVNGHEVFGAISPEARGTVDLNPILTEQTRLDDLYGGAGISDGSIIVSDGSSSVTIDISSAETIRGVVRLIESNPPTGRQITVRLSNNGLNIDIDDAGGGNLTIRDLGNGTTASELGILETVGTITSPIIGEDLEPRLTLTTPLSNILGVRAGAVVTSAGNNNDIYYESNLRGAAYNDITIQYVDDALLQASPGLLAGNETVSYSGVAVPARAALTLDGIDNDLILTATQPGTALNNVQINVTANNSIGDDAVVTFAGNVLTIEIDNTGATTVATLQARLATDGNFLATFDTSVEAGVAGTSTIAATSAGINVGNTGNSGGNAKTLFVNIAPNQTTANDVVAAVNNPAFGSPLSAILDGKDNSLAASAGLGKIDLNSTAITANGAGVEFDQSSGLQIVNGEEAFEISFQDDQTIEDLLNRLNNSNAHVLAELNEEGTSLNIRSRLSGTDFHIGENGGTTASELGLRTFTLETSLENLNHGFGVHSAEGTDFTILRNDGTELEIDISSAVTVGDVIDLINNHPDNLVTQTSITARLKAIGNGIEIVDDNPTGVNTLTVTRDIRSFAAWDLGIIPDGQLSALSSDSEPPLPATASISFTAPNDQNNSFDITATQSGTVFNGVQVVFNGTATPASAGLPLTGIDNDLLLTASTAGISLNDVEIVIDSSFDRGDSADVDYQIISGQKTLTLRIDDNDETRLQTLVDAINLDGTFTAAADPSSGEGFDGLSAVLSADGGVLTANTANSGTGVVGNNAFTTYDPVAKTLTIDIDPTSTTTSTVLNAIILEGTFSAALNSTADITNNGSGLIPIVGNVAVTNGGTPNFDASQAAVDLQFPVPFESNTGLTVTAIQPGTSHNGIDIVFQNTLVGDVATATYDSVQNQIVVDIDQTATTANTIIAAIIAEPSGEFTASLNSTNDLTNDGTGIVGTVGTIGTTTGGTPEVLTGIDTNPLETKGVFNSLIRLSDALSDTNPDRRVKLISRAVEMLDDDISRLSFARGAIGASLEGLEVTQSRVEEEDIELRKTLSLEIDVDQVDAVLGLTSRQAALEASLRASASTLQITLLDFI